MPKAKKKTKKKAATKTAAKRTVTCGKCKATGHNARTCPTSAVPPKVATPPEPKVKKEEPRRKSTVPPRDAPTAGNTSENNHAPYRCEKCSQVAILVAVRVLDHQATFKKGKNVYCPELRCEKCFNKPPAELILKWGCSPGEVVPVPDA